MIKIKQFIYKDQLYNGKEIADLCGIKYTTLMERLKRGYTVEEAMNEAPKVPESVVNFIETSDPHDWDGLSSEQLHKIYWNWCMKNEYKPESNIHFIRCLRQVLPTLRVVPSRVKEYGTVSYRRLIRFDDPYYDYK